MNPPRDPDSFELVTPFMEDHPKFALGVEFGMVYAKLNNPRRMRYQGMLHRANEERLCLMANRMGYQVVKRKKINRNWFYLAVRREGGS